MSDLTEQHRRAQLMLRARTLRDFTLLWPIWQAADPRTFDTFALAAIPLVRAYRQLSATLAASYYRAFRDAEQAAGIPAPKLAAAIDEQQILASIYVTGQLMTQKAIDSGKSAAAARETALTRVSGAVARHVLDGGRQTIIESAAADKSALGWARVTDGDPCYFCLTLAARGAVYKTEQTADFQAHDHCGCTAMPVFDGTTIPSLGRWRTIYDRAQAAAVDSGQLQHGENSSDARLNAVRHYLADQHAHV